MEIDKLIKEARLSKSDNLETLKLMKSEFLKAQIKGTRKVENPEGKSLSEIPLSPEEELAVLRSMVKSRKDSIDQYKKAGREDLAEAEEKELAVIQEFLPKEPGREEIIEKLRPLINSGQQMGPAMGIAKKNFPGVSGATLSGIVKELIS